MANVRQSPDQGQPDFPQEVYFGFPKSMLTGSPQCPSTVAITRREFLFFRECRNSLSSKIVIPDQYAHARNADLSCRKMALTDVGTVPESVQIKSCARESGTFSRLSGITEVFIQNN
jgi:hypothetical protein